MTDSTNGGVNPPQPPTRSEEEQTLLLWENKFRPSNAAAKELVRKYIRG